MWSDSFKVFAKLSVLLSSSSYSCRRLVVIYFKELNIVTNYDSLVWKRPNIFCAKESIFAAPYSATHDGGGSKNRLFLTVPSFSDLKTDVNVVPVDRVSPLLKLFKAQAAEYVSALQGN